MSTQDNQIEDAKLHRPDHSPFLKQFAQSDPTPTDDYKAFSFGRVGTRVQPMITFVKTDGYIEALSYATLDRVWSSNTAREIKLDFGQRRVFVDGNNLEEVIRYISSHRCCEVVENPCTGHVFQEVEKAVVSTIRILQLTL